MLTTPHAVTGAALGALLVNPILVVPVAFGSHFILDSIPHWQETLPPYTPTWKTWTRIPFDLALAVSLVALIAFWLPDRAAAIWMGAVAANLPDADVLLIVLPKLKRGLLAKTYDWHCRIQRETASLWGLVPQLTIMAAGLSLSYLIKIS
jgi:hypothetical protein